MPIETGEQGESTKLQKVIGYRVAVGFLVKAVIQLATNGRVDELLLERLRQVAK